MRKTSRPKASVGRVQDGQRGGCGLKGVAQIELRGLGDWRQNLWLSLPGFPRSGSFKAFLSSETGSREWPVWVIVRARAGEDTSQNGKPATRGRCGRTHRQGRGSGGPFASGSALRSKEPIRGGPASYPALRVPAGMCEWIQDQPAGSSAPPGGLGWWNLERAFMYLTPHQQMFPRCSPWAWSHITPTSSQKSLPASLVPAPQVSSPRPQISAAPQMSLTQDSHPS